MGGLFEELGAAKPKPGEAALQALRRELESRRDLWDRKGYVYRGAGDFILKHGQFWNGRVLPDQYAHLTGPDTHCFENTQNACHADGTLRYVEGVYSTGNGHFTPHAWALAPDGGMLEMTMPTTELERYHDHNGLPFLPPEHWAYAGVVFTVEFVDSHDERFGLPMLPRPTADQIHAHRIDMSEAHDFPLLKIPYDPNRTHLP